jgi:hypothetical protein
MDAAEILRSTVLLQSALEEGVTDWHPEAFPSRSMGKRYRL